MRRPPDNIIIAFLAGALAGIFAGINIRLWVEWEGHHVLEPTWKPANEPTTSNDGGARLMNDGWRKGKDELWRNDRFGGSYKTKNALKRIGSEHGEKTS